MYVIVYPECWVHIAGERRKINARATKEGFGTVRQVCDCGDWGGAGGGCDRENFQDTKGSATDGVGVESEMCVRATVAVGVRRVVDAWNCGWLVKMRVR